MPVTPPWQQALSEPAVHALPCGAARRGASDRITFFSLSEDALSGYGERPVRGSRCFVDTAPCMHQPGCRSRLDQGLDSGRVDARFTWVGESATGNAR